MDWVTASRTLNWGMNCFGLIDISQHWPQKMQLADDAKMQNSLQEREIWKAFTY